MKQDVFKEHKSVNERIEKSLLMEMIINTPIARYFLYAVISRPQNKVL